MIRMPNFLAMIEDYRCINLSACGKQLRPSTDLVKLDQQQSLIYVIDIFPGLYCQRVTPAGSLPRTTVSKAVLIVDFVSGLSQHRTDHLDPITMMNGEASVALPVGFRSHPPTNSERRVVKDGQAMPPTASSHVADDADYRTANNSRSLGDPQIQSQQSLHLKEVAISREGARESRRPQPPHPAQQGERFVGKWKKFL